MKKLKELPLNSLVIDLKSTFMGHPVVWVRTSITSEHVLSIQPEDSVPLYAYYILGRVGQRAYQKSLRGDQEISDFAKKVVSRGILPNMSLRFLNAADTSWNVNRLFEEIRGIPEYVTMDLSATNVQKGHSGNNYLDEYRPLPQTQEGFMKHLSQLFRQSLMTPVERLRNFHFEIYENPGQVQSVVFPTPPKVLPLIHYLTPSHPSSNWLAKSKVHQAFLDYVRERKYNPPKTEKFSSGNDSGKYLINTMYKNGSGGIFQEISSEAIKPFVFVNEDTLVSDEPLYVDRSGGEELNCYVLFPNDLPKISGEDENLGAKNDAFDIIYQVSDADSVTVTERLNGNTLRTLQNAPKNENLTISVSREQLFALPLHSQNTIEIRVDDGKGGISYRRYTFRRTNSAPVISGDDQELGEKTQPFSVSFSATDQENDAMSAKLYFDDKLLKTYETLPSEEVQTYEISKLDFVQLNSTEPHKIRIEVRDKNAATSIRNLTFTRRVRRLRYQLTKETDQMAKQIIISPTWFIAEGAVAKVEVCNNALDEHPTWENATEQVKEERQFNFTNQTKTAAHWAVGVQITIEKAAATQTSWLAGFGGGYK